MIFLAFLFLDAKVREFISRARTRMGFTKGTDDLPPSGVRGPARLRAGSGRGLPAACYAAGCAVEPFCPAGPCLPVRASLPIEFVLLRQLLSVCPVFLVLAFVC